MKRLAIAAMLVAGCAPARAPSPEIAAPTDPHDRAVLALASGSRALARADALDLDAAQRALTAAGARAENGTPDLAEAWHAEAQRIAGRPFADPPPARGRVLGSGYRSATVETGRSLTLEQIFMAGKKARVSVVPAAKTDLTLRVSEGAAPPLCAAAAKDAPASCSWLPTWTARYRIEVINRGARATPVYIVVN